MPTPAARMTRCTAFVAAALVVVGTLQPTQAVCGWMGCGVGCDHSVASLASEATAHCCGFCDAHSSDAGLPGQNAPQPPCDESCWCFAASQPYEATGKCLGDDLEVFTPTALPALGTTLASSRPLPFRAASPPLSSLDRCIQLSRFLA